MRELYRLDGEGLGSAGLSAAHQACKANDHAAYLNACEASAIHFDVRYLERPSTRYTDAPNPCQGVKGFTESGRDRYVSDVEFRAVHQAAHPTVQDAMDIALLTGQRPADVLKIMRTDVRDGAIFVRQNKTGAKRAIEIIGELAEVFARIDARPRDRLSAYLIQDDDGRPLTMCMLRSRFDKARKAAGVSFSVSRHSSQNGQRHGRSGPFSTPARAQESRHDRALRSRAGWAASQAASLRPTRRRARLAQIAWLGPFTARLAAVRRQG